MLISTSRVNSFKDNKIARARWANAICSLWKTYKRLFAPNCKRNHSITHYGSDNNDNNNKNVNTRSALKDCISQFWDTKTVEMNLSFPLRTFRLEIIIIVIITIIIINSSSSSSIVVVGSSCTCYNFVILKEYLLINFLSFADVITKAPSTIKTTTTAASTTTASTTTTISTPGLLLKDCILQFWHIKTVEMNLGFHMPTFWL